MSSFPTMEMVDMLSATADALADEVRQEQCRIAQLEALNSLTTSMDTGKVLSELLFQISRHVLTHRGDKAFTMEVCHDAIASVLEKRGLEQEANLEDAAGDRIKLVVEGLHDHAQEIRMPADDIMGQILWQHRRFPVLQKKRHRHAAAD